MYLSIFTTHGFVADADPVINVSISVIFSVHTELTKAKPNRPLCVAQQRWHRITFAGSWPTLTRPVMKKVNEVFVIFFTLLGGTSAKSLCEFHSDMGHRTDDALYDSI